MFVCGPSISAFEKQKAKETGVAPNLRFLETALKALAEIGFTKDRIKRESYG